MVVVLAQQAVGGEPQIVERSPDAGQIIPGLRRQRQRAVLPDEQPNPQFLLKPPDLMADRGLGDVQLASRVGKAQVPRSGLECAQSVQRWQPGGHVAVSLYMSLYHMKRHKVSFVENANSADIARNRLTLGDENVYLHT